MADKAPKILVLDDEVMMLQVFQEMLLRNRMEPVCCQTLEEAYRELIRQDIDAALVDLVLGGKGSGMDLLAFINKRKLNVPFILVSGRAEMSDVIEAFQESACDYVAKPFKEPEILNALHKALGRKKPGK